jgi:hypothetical protein
LTFIAQLCPILTFNSILVTPIIAFFDTKKHLSKLNRNEVDLVFELPTERFLRDDYHIMKHVSNNNGDYLIHYFQDKINEKLIIQTWGFTAFVAIIVSSILHGKMPNFEIAPSSILDLNNLNSFLENFLIKKLSISG